MEPGFGFCNPDYGEGVPHFIDKTSLSDRVVIAELEHYPEKLEVSADPVNVLNSLKSWLRSRSRERDDRLRGADANVQSRVLQQLFELCDCFSGSAESGKLSRHCSCRRV